MYPATLILLVFGVTSEPLILTYPQPSLVKCWVERNIERRYGTLRKNGAEVHAICVPGEVLEMRSEIGTG